jgi:16S rRNA (cytidine1402-2'-O)-methyltransferase
LPLYVVATPIGNLEDMSHRAVRVLGEAEVIAAEDTRAARVLLDRYQIPAGGGRLVSFFEGNEAERTEELLGRLRAGARVALISEAGTPGVSDPGTRLVAAAVAAGVRVEAIPGPSAALAALVVSGLPTDRFLFLGFPPREAGARRQLFGERRGERATLILYEAPPRVAATLSDLADALGGERRACVARELTKLHEEVVRGTLAELAGRARAAASSPRGEHTLVVAGASEAEARAAAALDVEAEARALLLEGLGPREVAARLAVASGKPRRQLYQLALALKGRGEGKPGSGGGPDDQD